MTDPVAETIAAYEQVAADYARRNAVATAPYVEFQGAFLDMLPPAAVVADVGCGPGRDAAAFRARGLRVVGFDRSREMLRRAVAAGVPVAFADLRALPVRDGSLDGLWSAASLLHVPRADVPATLRAWRVALRGGVLGLSTSVGGEEGWELVPYEVSSQAAPVGVRRWFVHHDADELLGLVEAAGFRVVSATERVAARRWLMVLAVATG